MLFSVILPLIGALYPAVFATPEVHIGHTTLLGKDVTGLGQDFFGGIPFAEPPIGQLRLAPPVCMKELPSGKFDASKYGAACLQPNISNVSEDCLTINVFRPSGLKPGADLPVLFWTYGGGFLYGTSAMYDGSRIVAQSMARGTPLIYVNFNYRLGPLGYPQGREAEKHGALNLGIKDQLAALEWVHDNIYYFGGDKGKVTLLGQSAGSMMTAILLLNPKLNKLARGAILESGMAASLLSFNGLRRDKDWTHFVGSVASCTNTVHSNDTFGCLKNAKSSDIFTGLLAAIDEAPEMFSFLPAIDGPGGVYPDIASRLLSKGQFAHLPTLVGTNLDEGTFLSRTDFSSEQALKDYIIANYTPSVRAPEELVDVVDKLLQLYPNVPALGSPYNTGNETFGFNSVYKQGAAIMGDIFFQSQRRYWTKTAAKHGIKSYAYLFTQAQPNKPPFLGVGHGAELSLVFGLPLVGVPLDNSTSATTLSRTMINYWISFVTSLDPNDGRGMQRPHWCEYTTTQQDIMQLNGNDLKMIPDNYREKQISFINSFPAIFHHRR